MISFEAQRCVMCRNLTSGKYKRKDGMVFESGNLVQGPVVICQGVEVQMYSYLTAALGRVGW